MKEKIRNYIKMWEERCYFDGIPDEAPRELESRLIVPSYRMICMAIMKNDISLKSLGYSVNKSIYYSELKYNQLFISGKINQLKLPI